jgi:hypothetical protein
MIIISIDITITKTGMILSEIEITYVYDLTHAWSKALRPVKKAFVFV